MSSDIIRQNPAANIVVANDEFPSRHILGISSFIVTYIIAPAAKESTYGRIGVINDASKIVKIAPRGSTVPEAKPCTNAFDGLFPSAHSGIDIILPSGMF